MTTVRTHLRFHVPESTDFPGCYAVVDIFTGLPFNLNGLLLDDLEGDEADNAVDILNEHGLKRRGQLKCRL
ncbi:hypothetical protein J2W42_005973 [Rhizobium tibeticum]|uniref:hypothetical protein n=1 Tax=Rhizobium tibeticum TaxID=501024 RepID=UPI002780A699|nr:hypothetical protein [Rhizobium tibeticum]MDP9813102.1 hypothetical protein [Rhizobium tibeticum]